MTASRPWYATRDMVVQALDVHPTPRLHGMIDRALGSSSQRLEEACGGLTWYPWIGTSRYDWPDSEQFTGRTLHLWSQRLTSVTAITSGGTAVAVGSYHLRPDTGPPYDQILLDEDTLPGYWQTSPTTGRENAVTVSGLWGHGADQTSDLGALNGAVTDTDGTIVLTSVTDPVRCSPGAILWIDGEIFQVTEVSWSDTGIDVGVGGIGGAVSDTLLPVSAAGLAPGQMILVGAEKMLVTAVASGSVVVSRAQHGTVIAAHLAAATVQAPWTLTVTRGALGSTAAAHDTATPVDVHRPPSLVEQATVALAIVDVQEQAAGYAHPAGAGGATQNMITGAGAGKLLDACVAAFAPKIRFGAI